LPGRPHVNITRNAELQVPENCYVATNLHDAIAKAKTLASEMSEVEAVIIGGAQIYAEALDVVQTLYVTEVHLTPEGDAFFPEIDSKKWQEVERITGDGDVSHDFVTYQQCQ